MTRRLTTALVFVLLALAGAAPATAAAQDNTAVAINTKDDSSLFRFAFSLKQVSGEVVDQTNAAVAYASCERCQTTAIAIQVLIVMTESPDVVMPANLAIAVNDQCSSCTTMALAYQFVVGTGGELRLTARGRHEIARIRRELRRLGREGLSAAEIRDQTAALVDELRSVLATELVPRRDDDDEAAEEQEDEEEERAAEREEDTPPADQGAGPGEAEPPTTTSPPETAPAPAPEPAPEDGTGTSPAP